MFQRFNAVSVSCTIEIIPLLKVEDVVYAMPPPLGFVDSLPSKVLVESRTIEV